MAEQGVPEKRRILTFMSDLRYMSQTDPESINRTRVCGSTNKFVRVPVGPICRFLTICARDAIWSPGAQGDDNFACTEFKDEAETPIEYSVTTLR